MCDGAGSFVCLFAAGLIFLTLYLSMCCSLQCDAFVPIGSEPNISRRVCGLQMRDAGAHWCGRLLLSAVVESVAIGSVSSAASRVARVLGAIVDLNLADVLQLRCASSPFSLGLSFFFSFFLSC